MSRDASGQSYNCKNKIGSSNAKRGDATEHLSQDCGGCRDDELDAEKYAYEMFCEASETRYSGTQQNLYRLAFLAGRESLRAEVERLRAKVADLSKDRPLADLHSGEYVDRMVAEAVNADRLRAVSIIEAKIHAMILRGLPKHSADAFARVKDAILNPESAGGEGRE